MPRHTVTLLPTRCLHLRPASVSSWTASSRMWLRLTRSLNNRTTRPRQSPFTVKNKDAKLINAIFKRKPATVTPHSCMWLQGPSSIRPVQHHRASREHKYVFFFYFRGGVAATRRKYFTVIMYERRNRGIFCPPPPWNIISSLLIEAGDSRQT